MKKFMTMDKPDLIEYLGVKKMEMAKLNKQPINMSSEINLPSRNHNVRFRDGLDASPSDMFLARSSSHP